MKPKSFKSKGVQGDALSDMALMQSLPDHYNVPIGQIKIDSKQQYFEIMWKNDNGGEILDTGDIVAVTIDDGKDIFLASISKVSMVGDHQRAILQSSKPSAEWARFLTELKKKCDSGHHNKKRKTLLHIIKTARYIEDNPESIQLQVRQKLAQENDPANSPGDLRDAVEKIQEAIEEAAAAGERLDLAELADLFLDYDVVIVDANHTSKQKKLDAMTIVANGVSLGISKTSDRKQLLTISEEALERALYYNTEQNSPVVVDKDELEDLLDTKQHRARVSVYSHDHDSIVYSNKSVQNITKSSNGEFKFELEPNLHAVSEIEDLESALESVLLTITIYDPVELVPEDPVDSVEPETDRLLPTLLEKNKMLEITPDMYKFESDLNTNKKKFVIDAPVDALSQITPGDTYLIGVDNLHAAVTVQNLIYEPEKRGEVEFSHKGGGRLDLLEAALALSGNNPIMKRLNNAYQQGGEAIQWTLEYLPGADLAGDNPPRAELVAIVDEIAALIREDQDGISVAELANWLEENHQLDPTALMVTGAEYKPNENGYNTESSVTGGFIIDVWMSACGGYSFFDLEPQYQFENVRSMVHSSTIVGDDEIKSEVEERGFVVILEEVRQQYIIQEADEPEQLQEARNLQSKKAHLSIYSEDGGYAVCNNEKIDKILRKKKDGKCIYRIVVKNSVRANRIHYGKHRKCIIYIDRYSPVVEEVE